MYWENMREEQFPIAITDFSGLCILPFTAMDKKAQYLPVGSDGMIVDSIIKEATKIENAVVFPTGSILGETSALPVNDENGKPTKKGAIQLSQDLQLTLLKDLCDEINRNGFRKILIVHKGAQDSNFLGVFMRYISYFRFPYAVLMVSAVNQEISKPENVLKTILERRDEFPMITDEDIKTLEKWSETGYGVKGGNIYFTYDKDTNFKDVALLMAENKELVAEDRYEAENYECTNASENLNNALVKYAGSGNMDYPNGCVGYAPYGCTKSIGEALLKINAEYLADVIKMIKEDERCVVNDARY